MIYNYSYNFLLSRKATSIEIFDFPTLFSSIPHDLLNDFIDNTFIHRKELYNTPISNLADVKATSRLILWMVTTDTLPVTCIYLMTEFLADTKYVQFGEVLRQAVDIPIGTNCAPLLADLFSYSSENKCWIDSSHTH